MKSESIGGSELSNSLRCHRLYSQAGSPVHGLLRGRILEWIVISFSRDVQFSSVQSLSHVWLFVIPWTAACQASLSITKSRSLLKLISIESEMSSNHLILCHPLLLLPSIFPTIRCPKYWSFSFNISPSNGHPGLISLQSKGLSRVFSNTTVQKHQFFSTQLTL